MVVGVRPGATPATHPSQYACTDQVLAWFKTGPTIVHTNNSIQAVNIELIESS
jgi:hypothetical protein